MAVKEDNHYPCDLFNFDMFDSREYFAKTYRSMKQWVTGWSEEGEGRRRMMYMYSPPTSLGSAYSKSVYFTLELLDGVLTVVDSNLDRNEGTLSFFLCSGNQHLMKVSQIDFSLDIE